MKKRSDVIELLKEIVEDETQPKQVRAEAREAIKNHERLLGEKGEKQ
jgi:uncharacterized protein (UPF0147 family)